MEQDSAPPKIHSLYGLKTLSEMAYSPQIPVGCKIFNDFLSGGIQAGALTEIYGESGTGKTQLSVQILLESLFDPLRKELSGVGVYISTAKHLHEVKFEALVNAFLKRHGLAAASAQQVRQSVLNFHTLDLKSFERTIDSEIPKIIASGTKIKGLVIDNIASISSELLENNDQKNLFERGIFLKSVSTRLKSLAYLNNFPVIAINNVISSFSEEFKKANKVVPALGGLWSSVVNERFKMHKYPENSRKTVVTNPGNSVLRSFKVKLSARLPRKELFYLIDNEGVKGITANV